MITSEIKPVPRTYTIRLSGRDGENWRECLLKTHEAVNRGAQRFGHWLLTLRGGISHELADQLPKKLDTTGHERRTGFIRDRRILLALSWLSVESKDHAPTEYLVKDPVVALHTILQSRGVQRQDIPKWISDCRDSLCATIRQDAVWLNRSVAFDDACKRIGPSLTREEIWDMLEPFVGGPDVYLGPIVAGSGQHDNSSDSGDTPNRTARDDEGKDLAQKASQWLSSRFGTGKGADFAAIRKSYLDLAQGSTNVTADRSGDQVVRGLAAQLDLDVETGALDGLLSIMSGPGYKSSTRKFLTKLRGQSMVSREDLESLREICEEDAHSCTMKMGSKGHQPYADHILADVEAACGIRYLAPGGSRHCQFCVMLDHAARRVSATHSWIKRAEERRLEFEQDRKRGETRKEIAPWAVGFLDSLCEHRSGDSIALDAYRIRKRAVDGWEEVVNAWAAIDPGLAEADSNVPSTAEAARIEKVRELRDQLEKFGDARLFEELASSEALCVWKPDGKVDARILLDYVRGKQAEYNMQRFKIPAYRHPDPLLHPVFCDFGKSRWSIHYAVHRRRTKLSVEERRLERKCTEAKGLRAALITAGDQKRSKTETRLADLERVIATVKAEIAWLKSPGGLRMGLWDGSKMRDFDLRWHCARLSRDLGSPETFPTTDVPRADRFGRVVSAIPAGAAAFPEALFGENEWSGRLQAPRDQLRRIAKLRAHHYVSEEERSRRIKNAMAELTWAVSFCARLTPQGPWIGYAAAQGFDCRFLPHRVENRKRGYCAKLTLCRLPGLRILSADLGHRYAAACAVWQTLSVKEFAAETAKARSRGEKFEIKDLYALKYGPQRQNGHCTTTIYRRLSGDAVPDGMPHPAAWARLERQFVVKLQGESEAARAASDEECGRVNQFYRTIGLLQKRETRDVQELMRSAVRAAGRGLRRHADLACISLAMRQQRRWVAGKPVDLNKDGYKNELGRALQRWLNLATAESRHAGEIQRLWAEFEESLHLPKLQFIVPEEGKQRAVRDSMLAEAAEILLCDSARRTEIGERFAHLWQKAEPQWEKNIGWLRRWVLPLANSPAIRHVGGLSLDRISTVQELNQLHRAHYQQLTPQGPQVRNGRPLTASANFFYRAQRNTQRMRENRVKQLASRICEAALGIGHEEKRESQHFQRDKKRASTRPDDPRFSACHAIVIENLERYRPDQSHSRRENRALMSWSAGQVFHHLSDACSLYGLRLLPISANYTSRQDSRTAVPGIRCVDVAVNEFVSGAFWKRSVARARKRCDESKGTQRDHFLVDLMQANWNNQEQIWTDQHGHRWRLGSQGGTSGADWEPISAVPNSRNIELQLPLSVRIPEPGGAIFVSAHQSDSVGGHSRGLQADMNAACNIGLRALMDPDWEGRWWYVLCDSESRPVRRNVKGCAAFSGVSVLTAPPSQQKNALINLWRNPSNQPLQHSSWLNHNDYWQRIEKQVVQLLRAQLHKK